MFIGQVLSHLPARAKEGFGQARTKNGRTLLIGDAADQCRPFFGSSLMGVVGKARRLPETTTLEAGKEHRQPPVGTISHRASGDGHGPIKLAIPLQLLKKDWHKTGDGTYSDIAL